MDLTQYPDCPILEYDEDNSMVSPSVQDDLLRDLAGVDTCVMTFFPELDKHPMAEKLTPLYRFIGGATVIMQYMYQDSLIVPTCLPAHRRQPP